MALFDSLVFVVAAVAGAVASVTGFGIGSLLTPLLTLQVDTRVAVAAVSIPHAIATALRLWMLRGQVDRRVLWSFGLTSAAGGLAGAALYGLASNRWLALVFGLLLLLVAASEMTGMARWMRFHGAVAWIAGAVSGMLGGLVGNQGGIRSAALLGFDLSKQAFVATATAIGLFVDGARIPVYLFTQHEEVLEIWAWVGLASAGVVVGTVVGSHVLARIPDVWFRRVLAVILALLGATMLARAL